LKSRKLIFRILTWGTVVGLALLSSMVLGMMLGFHMSLVPANDQKTYQKYILKGTYLFDRLDSVSDMSDDFSKRWLPAIREFSRNSRIGVYVGEGTDATPFLQVQLEKLGFDVIRFSHDEPEDIRQCEAIVFPGGHYDLGKWPSRTKKEFYDYVKNGGGFIGICLGVVAAKEIGLIEGELRPWPVTGFIRCKIIDRTVFQKTPSHSTMTFLHMNGRLLTDEPTLKPIIMFQQEVLAGYRHFGRGKIVLFSSHPEGGKIEYGNDYIILEGTTLNTMDLLLDAIFYVCKK